MDMHVDVRGPSDVDPGAIDPWDVSAPEQAGTGNGP
jgi:hypothetical protein